MNKISNNGMNLVKTKNKQKQTQQEYTKIEKKNKIKILLC